MRTEVLIFFRIGMAVGLASLAASTSVAASPTQAVARYEAAACPVAVGAGERIDCGRLIVPEHRGKPASRMIALPVMIFRSTAAKPAPDPVVYLPGGPGLSNVDGRTSGKGNPFLADRDQILLEGRGNAFAQPSLACPEVNALRADDRPDGAVVQAIARCRAALTAAGVDLDGYTSAEAADDLEDLRRLLGIRQWNLIGFSYGTRLAQTVLARHPDGVRSVVLDSVLPIDINYDETATSSLRRAIDLVLSNCASDPACDTHFPDLRAGFARLTAGADRGGRDIVEAIGSALQQPALIATLPLRISEAAAGRPDRLLALRDRSLSKFNWGLRLSIWCGEEFPFERADRVAAQVGRSQGLAGVDARTVSPAMCAAWRVAAAGPGANDPVSSSVPALILAGEYDPVTPPDWGRHLLRTMPNARFVTIAGQSHGAMFNRCGGQLTLAFLRDPSAPLNADCAASLRDVQFVVE